MLADDLLNISKYTFFLLFQLHFVLGLSYCPAVFCSAREHSFFCKKKNIRSHLGAYSTHPFDCKHMAPGMRNT